MSTTQMSNLDHDESSSSSEFRFLHFVRKIARSIFGSIFICQDVYVTEVGAKGDTLGPLLGSVIKLPALDFDDDGAGRKKETEMEEGGDEGAGDTSSDDNREEEEEEEEEEGGDGGEEAQTIDDNQLGKPTKTTDKEKKAKKTKTKTKTKKMSTFYDSKSLARWQSQKNIHIHNLADLKRKIERLLYKFDVEIDTELASGVDDECVICVTAKATMQTYPCGHKVTCRKCFIKNIKTVVSERILPLRCVICRTKILRLMLPSTTEMIRMYLDEQSSRARVY